MTLLKHEEICPACNIQYMVILNEVDLPSLTCCPFCATLIEIDKGESQEEDE